MAKSSKKTVVRRIKAGSIDKPTAKPASSRATDKAVNKTVKKVVTNKARQSKSDQAELSFKTLFNKNKKEQAKVELKPSKKPVWVLVPFVAIGNYFKQSWIELKKVKWPNRRATWTMTLAVILFSLFIGGFTLLFDGASQWLIEEVII